MTEIESVKQQIKVLQAKLEFLEEMQIYKTPAQEAYKEYCGEYPPITPGVDTTDDVSWEYFSAGWDAAQPRDNEVKEQPKTPSIYEFLIQCEYGDFEPPSYFDKQIKIETNAENFVNYLYEYCNIVSDDDDTLCVKIDKKQLGYLNN